jgi:hypothetical protein
MTRYPRGKSVPTQKHRTLKPLTGVLSESQLASCVVDAGMAAVAEPPPTVANNRIEN